MLFITRGLHMHIANNYGQSYVFFTASEFPCLVKVLALHLGEGPAAPGSEWSVSASFAGVLQPVENWLSSLSPTQFRRFVVLGNHPAGHAVGAQALAILKAFQFDISD